MKACPTGAIMFGSKTDMIAQAGDRVVDLKSRGFENAGLYDPPGVGGTHVMYVLHHADTPSHLCGPAGKPAYQRFRRSWKGVLKPIALAGIAFTAVAGFLHWVVWGANEVEDRDEKEGSELIRAEGGPEMTYPRGTFIRNTATPAVNHWITAACFVLLMISGSRCSIRCCSGSQPCSGADSGCARSIPGSASFSSSVTPE